VRANLLAAKAAILAGNEFKAKRYLLDVALQDESFFSEAVDVWLTFSVDAETLQSIAKIQCKTPSHSGLMYMISANKQLFGDEQAEQVVKNELVSNPSFSGLNQYLELKSSTLNDETNDLLKVVLERLHPIRANYECLHCGFRGSQMHWLCPSCKQWGEIRQRYGL
jgi:lipopolysaccharide biosynthesis regulator YciM